VKDSSALGRVSDVLPGSTGSRLGIQTINHIGRIKVNQCISFGN
jgi:hypothetical protein